MTDWILFREWARENKPPWLPFDWWWGLCKVLERKLR